MCCTLIINGVWNLAEKPPDHTDRKLIFVSATYNHDQVRQPP